MTIHYWDFCDSPTFVTHAANTSTTAGVFYPTTSGGYTWGYVSGSVTAFDRDAAAASSHLASGWTQAFTWAVDLTPGATYNIGVALGDSASAQSGMSVAIKDGSTTLFTVAGSTAQDHFLDANSVDFAEAAWEAGQTFQQITMVGSQLTVVMGTGILACVTIEPVASGIPAGVLAGLIEQGDL